MGSIAEEWIEQGFARGEARGKAAGIAEGKAETVLRLIQLNFGDLSSERSELVRKATTDQLDHWLEALLNAEALDDVFGTFRSH